MKRLLILIAVLTFGCSGMMPKPDKPNIPEIKIEPIHIIVTVDSNADYSSEFEKAGSAPTYGTKSTGDSYTSSEHNELYNAVVDNDTRLDTIEALTGPVFSGGDATYTDLSALSSTEMLRLNGITGALYYVGGTDVAIADGGTGAGTAAGGFAALLGTDYVYQSDCTTITSGWCRDSDDNQLHYWDGDSVETMGSQDLSAYLVDPGNPSQANAEDSTNTTEYIWTPQLIWYIPPEFLEDNYGWATALTADPSGAWVGKPAYFAGYAAGGSAADPADMNSDGYTGAYWAHCTALGSPNTWVAYRKADGTAVFDDIALPSATDPDIDTAGQISNDSDGANETGDVVLRGYDGSNQFAYGRKLKCIHATVPTPNDYADALRDKFQIWSNETGMTFTITKIEAWADTDDTAFNLEEYDADGASNNATIDAVNCTTGTGPYTATETTITGATFEADHTMFIDFDDTDTPGVVKITVCGWLNADVD